MVAIAFQRKVVFIRSTRSDSTTTPLKLLWSIYLNTASRAGASICAGEDARTDRVKPSTRQPVWSRHMQAIAPSVDPSPRDPSTLIFKIPSTGAIHTCAELFRAFHICHRTVATISNSGSDRTSSVQWQRKNICSTVSTSLLHRSHAGSESEVVEKKDDVEENELVLDGGFVVPETNSFSQTFRDYNAESERQSSVEQFYRTNHINQTYDFVKKMREEYGVLNRLEMSIWECCELLNEFVDDSDPDLDEPQIQHLLQTAEAIRKDYPSEDWLHLTGLIHDLGKVLLHPSFGALPQWAVVGDTFPVGCAFDESVIHHKYFKENPDYNNPAYNTKFGVYSEGCGLNNVLMSWGHDDYMYLVAKENKSTLPSAGLFIIRYHSFYALHRAGAYEHLMNEEDVENLKWLKIFSKYDLYSKSKVRIDVEKVEPYYLSLIKKYFPEKLKW